MRKRLLVIIKLLVSSALAAYLLMLLWRGEGFDQLAAREKNWALLTAASGVCFLAVAITFFRWYLLVRAVGLRFRVRDAFRLGFLGYSFNFVSLGTVGGDIFKAVLLAREQAGRPAQAVGTVVVDRIIGLYALGVVASVGVLAADFQAAGPEMLLLCQAMLTLTLVGSVALGLFLWPGLTAGPRFERLLRLPRIGRALTPVLESLRLYRNNLGALWAANLLSVAVHVCSTFGFYLIALGLFGYAPSLAAHFVVVPLAMLAASLPLPLGALGAFEAAVAALYAAMPGGVEFTAVQGLLVAIGYRAVTIVIALVGLGVWAASRREVASAIHAAENQTASCTAS